MLRFVKGSQVKRFNVQLRLVLILLIYLALAVSYSVVTPIGRGADEWAHYWYAQFIARHGRLPANPAERETAGYKSDWPPLYHLSAAALTAWIDTSGPPTFKYRPDTLFGKGQLRRQLVAVQGPDAILHTEDELFPWRQEILVWHVGRFLSIAFSAGTLAVTYFIAVEVFGGNRAQGRRGAGEQLRNLQLPITNYQTLALLSVAFLAFLPRFLFTGMLFNYDSLTLLLSALFLLAAVRVAAGRYSRGGYWLLGGLAGLALMTKYLTALLPVIIIFLVWNSRKIPSSPPVLHPSTPLLKLSQAAAAFSLVSSGWFAYLLLNFNEVDRYGPVLGIVAPLLRGDGSDRTVEQLFAWFSGGQAPPPAHIDQHSYSFGQITASFLTTLWANPVTQPYPLTWFVVIMTLIAVIAGIGWTIGRRISPLPHPSTLPALVLLYCLLPLPFMFIRLFGARDALEAVQGRHLLFLSGPALAILIVWGISRFTIYALRFTPPASRFVPHALRFTFYAFIGLLLTGSLAQLVYMVQIYPAPLPVQTTPYQAVQSSTPIPKITLPGGAKLLDYEMTGVDAAALKVSFTWQGGAEPAPEDCRLEVALWDGQNNVRMDWLAYQTQARYPTRAWEAGDIIRDEGWLPLGGLEPGAYKLQWRILGDKEPVFDWQTLTIFTLSRPTGQPISPPPQLWHNGVLAARPPLLRERETIQFTNLQSPISNLHLIGPDGAPHPPTAAGSTWANFIIGPEWPPGDYRLQPEGEVIFRVAPGQRNFQLPAIPHPLEVNFENKIKLLGYNLPGRRVQPGAGLPLTLYWQGLEWMGDNFVMFIRLLAQADHSAQGGYDRLAQENYSTLLWAPGEIITDGLAVPVAPNAPPGIYHLNIGWYRQVNGEASSLAVVNPDTGSTAVTIGPIKVGGPPPGVTVKNVTPKTSLKLNLGDQIALLGYDWDESVINHPPGVFGSCQLSTANCQLTITLYWQALTAPALDYTVFVHLRNEAGVIAAQQDGPPAGGAYPTGLWEAGEVIPDQRTVALPALSPGRYEVVVGMYDLASGARLPVAGSPDNAIALRSFEVSQ